jgi:hypothetical protein
MYDNKPVPVNRPVLVSIACTMLFIVGLISIVFAFFGVYAINGVLYSAIHMLLTITVFAALSGVWQMERWGIWLFSVMMFVKIGLDVFYHAFSFWELLLFLPILVFAKHFKEFGVSK